MIPARRRYCVARCGCMGVAVSFVPAPRGTVGRVSACADCYQRETGRPWDGPVPAVVPPPKVRQAPALRLVERQPEAVTVRAVEGRRTPSVSTLLSMTTRAMIWCEETGAKADGETLRAGLGLSVTESGSVVQNIRARGWQGSDGKLTAAAVVEARLRRVELDGLPAHVKNKPRHKPGPPMDPTAERYPCGRTVGPSDKARAAESKWRAEEAMLGEVRTRLLWWLLDGPRGGYGWMQRAGVDLDLDARQVRHGAKALAERGWMVEGMITDAGRAEATRRREVQARHQGGRKVAGWGVSNVG